MEKESLAQSATRDRAATSIVIYGITIDPEECSHILGAHHFCVCFAVGCGFSDDGSAWQWALAVIRAIAGGAWRTFVPLTLKLITNDETHENFQTVRIPDGSVSERDGVVLRRIESVDEPAELITNYPADLLDFYSGHDGQIVSKLAGSAFVYHVGLGMVRFTELVSKRDIASYQAVAHWPTIFQCYIEKQLELRITVVGEHVFAAEIHSQATNHTRYDWRRFDTGRTPYHIHALPSEVAQQCIALVRHFGLSYGAIDMILTPDGRYAFLKINPNGQYLWIEEMTSMPISAAICDFLVKGNVASCND
jgi:hypothetical protein